MLEAGCREAQRIFDVIGLVEDQLAGVAEIIEAQNRRERDNQPDRPAVEQRAKAGFINDAG